MRTIDQKTQFAPKRTSFGSIRKVPPFEGARWKNGRAPINSPLRRDWTHEDVDRLVAMLDNGRDYDYCARQLRRTRTAIIVKTKRLKCKMTNRPTVLTAREVARVLGVSCAKTVAGWIDQGWLKARRAGRIWRITWDDLMAFLENPAGWISWEPERITDVDVREQARALRHDRLLTQGEVAARYHVGVETVGQWLDKGWISAQRYGARGNRMIPESALLGWVPPCERSKAGIPKRMGRAVVGARMIVARPL